MNIPLLKQNAAQRIAQAGNAPAKLAFISTGLGLAAGILSGLITLAVGNYQGGEGLSGMGAARVLQVLDQSLGILANLLIPFWSVGLAAAIFAFANGETPGFPTLLVGFRRFPVFLRLFLIKVLVIVLLAMVVYTPATMLFGFTPSGQEFQRQIAADPNILENSQAVEALYGLMGPMALIYGGLMLLAYLPVSYRLRLAQYYLFAGCGSAMMAIGTSLAATRGRVKELVKLDLSFWWYHLASMALMAVCYLDVIAPYLGWELPWGATAAFWVCYLSYAVGYLLLQTFAFPRVEAANVFFFRSVAYIPVKRQENNDQ